MPDLVLFRPLPNTFAADSTTTTANLPPVLFAEVKGPRDKLSAAQEVWIHYLLGIGLTAQVLHVHDAIKSNVRYEDASLTNR